MDNPAEQTLGSATAKDTFWLDLEAVLPRRGCCCCLLAEVWEESLDKSLDKWEADPTEVKEDRLVRRLALILPRLSPAR